MVKPSQKAKLKWHCRRGMLELDLILNHFVDNQLDKLNENQLKAFDSLLHCTDPELFGWLMGHEEVSDRDLEEIVNIIKMQNIIR